MAVTAQEKRPAPSRTRKLSPGTAMILHPTGCGKVAHRHHNTYNKGSIPYLQQITDRAFFHIYIYTVAGYAVSEGLNRISYYIGVRVIRDLYFIIIPACPWLSCCENA